MHEKMSNEECRTILQVILEAVPMREDAKGLLKSVINEFDRRDKEDAEK